MKLNEEEVKEIEFLYMGYMELLEKAKKMALEENLKFLEKEGTRITPEEFLEMAIKRKEISPKYKPEIDRYKRMLLKKISSIINEDLSNAKIIKFVGIPKAPINEFEIEKGNKKEIVKIDKNKMLIEILEGEK